MRNQIMILFTLLSVMSFLMLMLGCTNLEPADMILRNGNIVTMEGEMPRAEAVAVKADRIIKVGSNEEVDKYEDANTRVIDLEGRTVIPGMIDAHVHLMSLGEKLVELDFAGTTGPEQIVKMVAAKAKESNSGEWIKGKGWDQNDWKVKQFPTHDMLSKVAPENPVYLSRIGGHAICVNKKAMEIAGITKNTLDPPGGKIVRDIHGEPTGIFIDNAKKLIKDHVPDYTYEQRKEMTRRAVAECLKYGLTGIHNAGGIDEIGGSFESLELVKDLIDKGELKIRMYVMIGGNSVYLDDYFAQLPEIGYGNNLLTIRAIKLGVDGALGSRGAALLEDYSDDPGNRGLVTRDTDSIYQITRDALKHGYQVCVHSIGDRGNRFTLDAFEKALNEVPTNDPRLRVEHAQVVALEDIPRFAKLGVIPSMQPTHCTSDMYWAEDRLGPERVKGAYAWRKFLDTGAKIAGGSDFPVETVNPIWEVYAAVTRQDHESWPAGGWYPEERVTREEALRMYTVDAAYAAFEEGIKGSLKEGKLADLVILSKDIMTIPVPEILDTEVLMTILGGEIVYEKDEM